VRVVGRFAEDDEAIARKKRDGKKKISKKKKGNLSREETKRILGVCLEML
jgi:hypothetical protein